MFRFLSNRGIPFAITKAKRSLSSGTQRLLCGGFCKPVAVSLFSNVHFNESPMFVQTRCFSSSHEKYMKIEFVLLFLFIFSMKKRTSKKEKSSKVIQLKAFSVALVGRTNVGKSTLYNRLIGRRDAIVSKTEGTTRDRREGKGSISGLEFTLMDTGGYVTNYKNITE